MNAGSMRDDVANGPTGSTSKAGRSGCGEPQRTPVQSSPAGRENDTRMLCGSDMVGRFGNAATPTLRPGSTDSGEAAQACGQRVAA
jgi:hypothetical protein